MSDEARLKILLVGPVKAGKSMIANYLAGVSQNLQGDYHGTVALRILEFEREIATTKKQWQGATKKVQIELWDCSGDRKYENGWSAIKEGADGVVIVFNPENKKAENEIQNWHNHFVQTQGLKDNQCMILAHNSSGEATAPKFNKKLPHSLSKVPLFNTSLDTDAELTRNEFDNLVNSVSKEKFEKRDNEELSILGE
ncbi:hypothetical protein PROFUN_05689 [Planoprotostelium fungivorum]|uniref:Rab-like protein 5 n=1 Tax=Planoprotostelium fungivorum TaxID=1890364 RepID=A0A2P6NQE2_9EUKA|nr:hypothetical protein PROFUN_05689 [Planoprotostelium fungivorum]